MTKAVSLFLDGVGIFFLTYLVIYASYLFLSVAMGAWNLYKRDKMLLIKNELKHDFYFPVSILVPAYNEEVTILDSIKSLFNLDYRLYEIIVIDDGSTDKTAETVISFFDMHKVSKPIRLVLKCQEIEAIYETELDNIRLTLICKKNGGKGDALNVGINASQYPYFLCIDADSMLQRDSLERIVQPVMEDDGVIAVGGLIRIAQCISLENGNAVGYHLPWNPLLSMQVMEYDRSFLASRILLDAFNGNLIISGAFGLFKKDIAVAVGGYDTYTLGEDMELVMNLHTFSRNNEMKYSIRYEPNAVCWSQAPSSMGDLAKQRRRWHLGLFQSMMKYRSMFLNPRFGLVGFFSYIYYLIYELFTPVIEIFGIITIIIAGLFGLLNIPFMIQFYVLYVVYGAVLTITAFFQRIYTQNLKISGSDILRAVVICFLESMFFRFVLAFIRSTALLRYSQYKNNWDKIKRERHSEIKL